MSKHRQQASAPDANDPFAGADYRVRMIEMKFHVDVYDSNGNLIARPITDPPFAVPEADFPRDLCALIVAKTNIKRGFECLKERESDLAGPVSMEEAG